MKLFLLLALIPVVTHGQPGTSSSSPSQSLLQRGDECARRNGYEEAIVLYRSAMGFSLEEDMTALQRISTVHAWMRDFTAARQTLAEARERDPENQSVQEQLADIERRRGTHIALGVGGEEIDFTRNVRGARAWYGGIDWLDLEAGASQTDKEFYRRSSMWMNAHIFPSYLTYVRIGLQQKSYDYPQAALAAPDDNAYGKVPDLQLEVGYHYHGDDYASIELEYFTPDFYLDKSVRARNHKVGATVRNRIAGPFYGKVFGAILHDPDPTTFLLAPSTRSIRSFEYATQTLVGGALGFDGTEWAGEIKFIPDRDLDRSLSWSLLGQLQYRTGDVTFRYDGLYDRYPLTSTRSTRVAQAHMITGTFEPLPALDVTPGVKVLMRDGTFVVPLLSVQLKTSL